MQASWSTCQDQIKGPYQTTTIVRVRDTKPGLMEEHDKVTRAEWMMMMMVYPNPISDRWRNALLAMAMAGNGNADGDLGERTEQSGAACSC
jgi:ABC-type sulfate transport system substrate-binding protein